MGEDHARATNLLEEARSLVATNPHRAALSASESYALLPGLEAAELASRANATVGFGREASTWLDAAATHAASAAEKLHLVELRLTQSRTNVVAPAPSVAPTPRRVQTPMAQAAGALVGSTYLVEMVLTAEAMWAESLPSWLRAGVWVVTFWALSVWQREVRRHLAERGVETRSAVDLVQPAAWAQLDRSLLRLPMVVPPLVKLSAVAACGGAVVLLAPASLTPHAWVLWGHAAVDLFLMVMVWFISCWSALPVTASSSRTPERLNVRDVLSLMLAVPAAVGVALALRPAPPPPVPVVWARPYQPPRDSDWPKRTPSDVVVATFPGGDVREIEVQQLWLRLPPLVRAPLMPYRASEVRRALVRCLSAIKQLDATLTAGINARLRIGLYLEADQSRLKQALDRVTQPVIDEQRLAQVILPSDAVEERPATQPTTRRPQLPKTHHVLGQLVTTDVLEEGTVLVQVPTAAVEPDFWVWLELVAASNGALYSQRHVIPYVQVRSPEGTLPLDGMGGPHIGARLGMNNTVLTLVDATFTSESADDGHADFARQLFLDNEEALQACLIFELWPRRDPERARYRTPTTFEETREFAFSVDRGIVRVEGGGCAPVLERWRVPNAPRGAGRIRLTVNSAL